MACWPSNNNTVSPGRQTRALLLCAIQAKISYFDYRVWKVLILTFCVRRWSRKLRWWCPSSRMTVFHRWVDTSGQQIKRPAWPVWGITETPASWTLCCSALVTPTYWPSTLCWTNTRYCSLIFSFLELYLIVVQLFLGGSEAAQQDQFEEVWNEGWTDGAAGGSAEGSVDLPRYARAQFEL